MQDCDGGRKLDRYLPTLVPIHEDPTDPHTNITNNVRYHQLQSFPMLFK